MIHFKTALIDLWDPPFQWSKYRNGQNCLAISGYIVCSVSLDVIIPNNCILIKDYSENEGVLETLVYNKIIGHTLRFFASGFVRIPMCKIL